MIFKFIKYYMSKPETIKDANYIQVMQIAVNYKYEILVIFKILILLVIISWFNYIVKKYEKNSYLNNKLETSLIVIL